MVTVTTPTQHEQVMQQAEAYRRQGYTVLVRPQPEDLPEFLQPYRPTLVIERSDDRAVVEIQSHHSLTPPLGHYLQTLAQAVAQHADWRLELIMTPVEHPGTTLPPSSSAWTIPDLQQRLPRLQRLQETDPEVALLYGWSLAEAALRLIADQEGIGPNLYQGTTLAKQLVMEGAIDRSLYTALLELADSRNAVAHGFQAPLVVQDLVKPMLAVLEQLMLSLTAA